MKVGDLVKITRPFDVIPINTLGLVLDITFADSGFRYFKIQMYGLPGGTSVGGNTRRFLGRDLEVINESR